MEETTTEQAWPEWDDTFAEHDARILFPDLYKGRNGARNNEPYDVDSGDRRNPIIGVPGNGGIQWSEGNKLIDDAYPDYTPPEPYDFEKAIAEWDSGTLHKPNLRGEGETASPGAVFESRPVSSSSKKRDDGAFSQAKFSDWNPPTRKDSIASHQHSFEFPPTPGRYPSLSATDIFQFKSPNHSSPIEDGPAAKKQKLNSTEKNANREAKQKVGAGGEVSTASSSLSQDEYDGDGVFPPTPGAPSDMNAEKDWDITMNDVEPAHASTVFLPTPEGQDEIVHTDTDVQMSEDVHVKTDATFGAERTERSDNKGVRDDPAEHTEFVAEDVVMGPNSVAPTQQTEFDLAEHSKQIKSQDGKGAQSRHLLSPLPFATPAPVARTHLIVEIPAPPGSLSAASASEAKATGTKPTLKGQIDKSGAINNTGKLSQGPGSKNSAGQHKSTQASVPTTPPGKKKQIQVSVASSPAVTASPLKLLQESVKMGRKSSFSEAQASSEDTSKVKTKGRPSAGIISRTDDDLVDDFVFMDVKVVEKMKLPEVRILIRGIESLRRYHNGLPKPQMVDQFMKWQGQMQALKDKRVEEVARAEEISQAGGLGSEEEEEEEEEDDLDAEGSIDEEFFDAQESPVTGNVTPGHPLKSPFTNQPRSKKESPFVAKLNAAKLSAGSPMRKKAGKSRSPETDGLNEPEFYRKFEEEEEKEKEKEKMRKRRSVSRPVSYKV